MDKRKKLFIILISFVVIVCLYVGYSYGKVEYLTSKYGDQFEGLQGQTGILGDEEIIKVFEYSNTKAEVLYISTGDDRYSATVYYIKDGGDWVLDTWDTNWSKDGSADDLTWPCYGKSFF